MSVKSLSKYETYKALDAVWVDWFHRMYPDDGGGDVFGNGNGVEPDTSAK
jgi:hypothetical protein